MMASADKYGPYSKLKAAFDNAVVIAKCLLSGDGKNIAAVSHETFIIKN